MSPSSSTALIRGCLFGGCHNKHVGAQLWPVGAGTEYQALAQLEQVQTGYEGTLERLLLTLDCSLSHPSSSYQGTSLRYDLCPLSFTAR